MRGRGWKSLGQERTSSHKHTYTLEHAYVAVCTCSFEGEGTAAVRATRSHGMVVEDRSGPSTDLEDEGGGVGGHMSQWVGACGERGFGCQGGCGEGAVALQEVHGGAVGGAGAGDEGKGGKGGGGRGTRHAGSPYHPPGGMCGENH